jgi:2-dehydro-3-deoxyphosphogluconate aldolase/(4S)-4-hydroxy-2-oxoglutarate aldolase
MSVLALFPRRTVIPVVTVRDPGPAVRLAQALLAGGLHSIEVTLRTDQALLCARRIIEQVPDIRVGIGTILTVDALKAAADTGARFLVSPGVTKKVARAAAGCGVPYLPGVSNATDVMRACELGFPMLKFFPAEAAGGIAVLRQFMQVFPDVGFCPTGGINESNVERYFSQDNVFAVGGSWITPSELIQAGDWDGIQQRAAAAARLGQRFA